MPATGGPATRITKHQAGDFDPAWSPDGTQLVFQSERSGNSDLWVIPVTDQTPVTPASWGLIKSTFHRLR